jgi:type I restriction enzyme R subunit
MPLSGNFWFLSGQNEQLAQLGALAERYFRDDPATAIFKLRQFAELLSKIIAARHAVYLGDREAFEETLRRLSYERIIPKEPPTCSTPCEGLATAPSMKPGVAIQTRSPH